MEQRLRKVKKTMVDFVHPHVSGSAIAMDEDNERAKVLAENRQGSHRRKHIDVRFHFIRELMGLQQVAIHSVVSVKKHADILTKALGRKAFRRQSDL